MVAALARRGRAGGVPLVDVARAIADFRADLQWNYRIIEVSEAVISAAMDVAQRHALRGYDSVQLAAGFAARTVAQLSGMPFIFVSSDRELNAAAAMEGLAVDDPNRHP